MPEKLVRDNIPAIIRANGTTPKIRTLNDEEYLLALDVKLQEEVTEYLEANDLSELADIIEVVRAIADAQGSNYKQIETIRQDKLETRGGFKDKISLEM